MKKQIIKQLEEVIYNLNRMNVVGNIVTVRQGTPGEYDEIIIEDLKEDMLNVMLDATHGLRTKGEDLFVSFTKKWIDANNYKLVGLISPRVAYISERQRKELGIIYE